MEVGGARWSHTRRSVLCINLIVYQTPLFQERMHPRYNLHLLSILCSFTPFHLLMPLHTSACWWAFAAHALVPAYALTPTRTLVPAHAFVLPCTHLYPIMPLHPPCSCSHTWTHTHSCTHLHPYARSQLRHLVKLSLLNYFVFWILVRLPVVWSSFLW